MAEPQDAPSSLESSSSSSSLPVEPSYPIRFDRNFDYSQRIVTSVAPPAGPGPLDPEKLWDEERRPRIDVVRDWLFREGRFRVEDALEIVEKATAVFCQEPNLLQLQSPLTSPSFSSSPLLLLFPPSLRLSSSALTLGGARAKFAETSTASITTS